MNKTRGLLSLVALLTIVGQILIFNSHLPNVWQFTLYVADGILLLSALIMLLFSFFRVGVTECGELCYNPDNIYWKTMILFYDGYDDFYRGKVSLCKAFWLTVFAIFLVICVSVLIAAVINLIWVVYWKHGLLKMILAVALLCVVVAMIVAAIHYGIIFGHKVGERYYRVTEDRPRLRNAVETVQSVLAMFVVIGAVFFMVVVIPIVLIMEKAEVSFFMAVIYYLVGVVGLSLMVGGAVLLIWFVFKYLPRVMGNTILGQLLVAKKKQFCPTLTVCSTKSRGLSLS